MLFDFDFATSTNFFIVRTKYQIPKSFLFQSTYEISFYPHISFEYYASSELLPPNFEFIAFMNPLNPTIFAHDFQLPENSLSQLDLSLQPSKLIGGPALIFVDHIQSQLVESGLYAGLVEQASGKVVEEALMEVGESVGEQSAEGAFGDACPVEGVGCEVVDDRHGQVVHAHVFSLLFGWRDLGRLGGGPAVG